MVVLSAQSTNMLAQLFKYSASLLAQANAPPQAHYNQMQQT
jgi:hypothetical protein